MANRLTDSGPLWPVVVVWYATAAVAVTSSRGVLKATGMPFTLSASQFGISAVLSEKMLVHVLPWLTEGSFRPVLRDLGFDRPERKLVRSIAITYCLGFGFTNVGFSLCNASFIETVKSAEPVSSLALAQLTRGEDAVRRSEWLTTVPIVAGVALSSWSDASFHLLGFVAAVCSNFMFSARGINAKTLRRLHGTPQGLDDMHLFYHVSKFGASFAVPLALVFEGPKLLRLIFKRRTSVKAAVVASLASAAPTLGGLANSTAPLAESASRILTPVAAAAAEATGMTLWQVISAVILNGICYWAYNQASFVVLGRVPFVTHATFNVMRRVWIIMFTAWYFGTSITGVNALGIGLAISGFALFLYLKVSYSRQTPLPK